MLDGIPESAELFGCLLIANHLKGFLPAPHNNPGEYRTVKAVWVAWVNGAEKRKTYELLQAASLSANEISGTMRPWESNRLETSRCHGYASLVAEPPDEATTTLRPGAIDNPDFAETAARGASMYPLRLTLAQ
jgi:hypothetical protein